MNVAPGKEVHVQLGSTLHLECRIAGCENPAPTWTHEGYQLPTKEITETKNSHESSGDGEVDTLSKNISSQNIEQLLQVDIKRNINDTANKQMLAFNNKTSSIVKNKELPPVKKKVQNVHSKISSNNAVQQPEIDFHGHSNTSAHEGIVIMHTHKFIDNIQIM